MEWTLQAQGLGEPPTNKILPRKPTPRSYFCLLAPAQLSMQIPLLGGVDPVGPSFGWTPPKKNFGQTHPKEQLLFAGSRPILNPSGNFRWGQYGRYPWGPTIWVAPWLGAEPGWNEEPMPNFGVMACVSPAAGRRTHTHTYFHLYILDSIKLSSIILDLISCNLIKSGYTVLKTGFWGMCLETIKTGTSWLIGGFRVQWVQSSVILGNKHNRMKIRPISNVNFFCKKNKMSQIA